MSQQPRGTEEKGPRFPSLACAPSVDRVTDLLHSGVEGMGLVGVDVVGGAWNRLRGDREEQASAQLCRRTTPDRFGPGADPLPLPDDEPVTLKQRR